MRPRALVTGTARGIGASIAERLSDTGHVVVGVDRTEHEASYLAETILVDLGDAEACSHVVDGHEPFDVLVNNAGVLVDKPLEQTTVEEINRLLWVNLRAPILLTQAIVPTMAARGHGRIINVSSVGARTGGYATSGVYNTTKAGLISFTKYLARHYGPMGITANAVAPGGIRTEMMGHLSPSQMAEYQALIPVGRLGTTRDVADAVGFLVSERAGFINGVTLDVNGGWVMA